MNFNEVIKTQEYDFLRNNEQIKDRIMLLTLGGSYAYGTNKTDGTSDIDVRGIVYEKPRDLIGFGKFEQFEDKNTDTVLYGFNKMIKLLTSNNPNTIEILGCKPEHYLILSEEGRQLLNNKKMFLSQRCINSFSGYAYQQLNRLTNALARDRKSFEDKEKHILNSLQSAILSFNTRYNNFEKGEINLYIDTDINSEHEKELFIDINYSKAPLREVNGMIGEFNNIVRDYDKLNHRNNKKDDNHLNKHSMHLIRLFLMAIDILEKEDVITYRESDLELLRNIRNGFYQKENGDYDDSFFDLVEEQKKRLEYAVKNTSLQLHPKEKEIEEFVMEINTKIIKGEI